VGVSDRTAWVWRWSLLVVGSVALGGEVLRWLDPAERQLALTRSLCGVEADWLPFLPLLFGWLVLARSGWREQAAPIVGTAMSSGSAFCGERWRPWGLALFVGLTAFGASIGLSRRFFEDGGRPLPPAYHDEYSYLLQAETFLAGRTWWPSFEPRPELFNQMHVLNEGRMASRYFPGTGAWLAPFVALGNPWLGQQLAHAIAAVLTFWIGRQLRDNVGGLLAGLLYAVSPGLLLFSNLLLAHSPTLVGLLAFLGALLRMQRTGSPVMALLAGGGLAWAMLCRPLTAAGFALPWGVWCGWFLGTGRLVAASTSDVQPKPLPMRQRLLLLTALGAPLLAGLLLLLWYSWSITGDPFTSPYQLYTDLYTPRHVYGFNNVVRGETRLGPKVLEHYDRWAENLTPTLAVQNVGRRLAASLRLTLGMVPLLLAAVWWLLSGRCRTAVSFLLAAIVSLHAVHVPYWFVGIMGWHYVLETAPLWLLLVGVMVSDLWRVDWGQRWLSPRWWAAGLLVIAMAVNTLTVPLVREADGEWLLWPGRVERLAGEVRYPRVRYAAVREEVDRLRQGASAVVLVLPDPSDRSMDYVTNHPSLAGEVLWVRVPAGEGTPAGLRAIAALFPGRRAIVWDAAAGRLHLLSGE
jgi:hypothetical protein